MASVERYRDVKRGDWLIVLGVVLAHVTALVLVSLSTPEVVKTKKSMITVEIGASAPPGAAAPGILQATAESVSAVPGVASAPSPEPQSILKSDPPPMLQSKSQQQTETDTRSQPEPEPDPEPKPEKEPEPEPKSEPVPAPVPAAVPAPKPEPKPEPKPRPRPPVDTPKPSSRPAAPTTAQSGSTTTPGMAGSTAPSVSSAPAGGGGGAVVDADYKAAYLRNPKPIYPSAALKMRVEGTVTLRVLVLEDGTSGKIVLSKSSGNESLDQSALETVAKWKFTPAKSQGQSIAQWVSIPINFQSNGVRSHMSIPSNWAVDLTLVILLALSVATWSIAAIKLRRFRALRRLNETFLKTFSKERDWQKACQMAKDSHSECAQLALDGFMTCKEMNQEQGGQVDLNDAQQLLERELHKTLQIFNRRREKGLTELASIGSTAPFIGLFGTVWGIMNALVTISATGQASIDVVAGPIGEALIATAIGIATAVPAVLAYNYFLRQQRVLSGQLSEFAEDFLRFAIRNHKRWSESC